MHKIHPSVTPGAIIGYRRNGAPIRLIAGGNGEGDNGDGAGDGQGGAGAGDGQTNQPNGDAGTGGQPSGGTGSTEPGTSTPPAGTPADDAAARTIAAIRDDYKTERAKRQQLEKDLADIKAAQAKQADDTKARDLALAKALGLATDEPPDPAKLAAELEAERKAKQEAIDKATSRERELLVENELLKQAGKLDADPVLLLDSRSFTSKLLKLDPASEDFATDLADAIKAATEANPTYKLTKTPPAPAGGQSNSGGSGDGQPAKNGAKTTAPPARSGSSDGHNGAPGGGRQWTDADVKAASPKELTAAIEAGLLTDMGFHPSRKSRR